MMITAGEKSGLLLASLIEQEIARLSPVANVRIVNVARTTGSTLGFWEGLLRVKRGGEMVNQVVKEITNWQPDVVVLIAFPGINLIVGRRCRQMGIKVVYVAPPQVWAWGRFRLRLLKGAADRVVCLFKFESDILSKAGLRTSYYGYPFLDAIVVSHSPDDVLRMLGLEEGKEVIVFLPGSRAGEVAFHQPLFVQTFSRLRQKYPDLTGVMVGERQIELPEGMVMVSPEWRYDVIACARLAVVVSGTVTAETAYLGTPMVACYHLAQPSRFLARLMVRLRYFSLPNIIAGSLVVPELLAPSEAQLYRVIGRVLDDERYRQEMVNGLKEVKKQLLPAGATRRIAEAIVNMGESSFDREEV